MIAIALLWACGTAEIGDQGAVDPVEIGLAECALCGMVVGEQPAPRGQLAYRDGTRAHTCSVEEVRALAEAPGGKGRPVAVFVEALEPDFDWRKTSTDPRGWMPVGEAWFVFGAPRTQVMGVPVLTYSDLEVAAQVASELGSTPVRWADLMATAVPAVPPEAGWSRPEPAMPLGERR